MKDEKESPDSKPLLIPSPGGDYNIAIRGRLIYDRIAPRKAARRRAVSVPAEEHTLYYVPSLGLGYGLRTLVQRCPSSSRILCVEASESMMALAVAHAPHPLPTDSRLTVVRCDRPEALLQALDPLQETRLRRVRTVTLNAGYALQPEIYRSLRDRFDFLKEQLLLEAGGEG